MQSWLKDAAKRLWSLALKLFKTPNRLKNKKGEKKKKNIRMICASMYFITTEQNLPIHTWYRAYLVKAALFFFSVHSTRGKVQVCHNVCTFLVLKSPYAILGTYLIIMKHLTVTETSKRNDNVEFFDSSFNKKPTKWVGGCLFWTRGQFSKWSQNLLISLLSDIPQRYLNGSISNRNYNS